MKTAGRVGGVPRLAAGLLAALLLLAGGPTVAWAQGRIYTCVDAKGRRLTSDRPIPECMDRAQDLRNSDGSVRGQLPPSMTAEERAAFEEAQRAQLAREAARKDAIRHDRNLLARYPDDAAHQRARQAALEPLEAALKSTDRRLATLASERKALEDEAEFYRGRELPRKLKLRFDDNKAAHDAQRTSAANQHAELQRINARYDEELARLRKLWAGAAPGSLGPAAATASAP